MTPDDKKRIEDLRNKTAYDLDWFYKKTENAPQQYQDVAFLLTQLEEAHAALRAAEEVCACGLKPHRADCPGTLARKALGEE